MTSPVLVYTMIYENMDSGRGAPPFKWYWGTPFESHHAENKLRPLIIDCGIHLHKSVQHWEDRTSAHFYISPHEVKEYFAEFGEDTTRGLHRLPEKDLELLLTKGQRRALSQEREPYYLS